jgi:hypothetical protein
VPKYVILADHAPEICPSSNARTRARAAEALNPEAMGKLMSEFELTFSVEPMHLDPSHRTVAIVEAATVEAVVSFVNRSGLSQWNTVEVCPTTPISEMMGDLEEFPIIWE